MVKVIKRNMEVRVVDLKPEQNLIVAIIACAVIDLADASYRRSALRFFDDELFDIYCNMVSLNPVTTRQLLVQGGFL